MKKLNKINSHFVGLVLIIKAWNHVKGWGANQTKQGVIGSGSR